MDSEAIQLLNLSPIPELSEFELSTMLDHLSGLSDVNGDLTDRNVEELLKEAEDLLDKSESSKTLESKELDEGPETEENKSLGCQNVNELNGNEDFSSKHSNVNSSKHHNAPVKSINDVPENIPSDSNDNKHYNSPIETTPTKIYSPGGNCNHIKSTIDSLREFSTIIEQALSNRTPKSSPQQKSAIKLNGKESSVAEETLIVKSINSKQVNNTFKSTKSPDKITKPLNKSVKLLNCFERLYQDRPVRLLMSKKPKVTDKVPKNTLKSKFSKDLRNVKKGSWPSNTVSRNVLGEDIEVNAKIFEKRNVPVIQTSVGEDSLPKPNKINVQNCFLANHNVSSPKKKAEKGTHDEFSKIKLNRSFQSDCLKAVQAKFEENLMLKGLEDLDDLDEMKDQVKKLSKVQEKDIKEDLKGRSESSEVELEEEGEKFCSESVKNTSIKRLEEQFSSLKEKYDHQIEKLESENFRLKIALNHPKIIASQISAYSDIFMSGGVISNETNGYKNSLLSSPSSATKKKIENFSPEKCKTPENSLCDASENVQRSSALKEAFTQTEDVVKSVCVQCCQECRETKANGNSDILERGKTENKENLTLKKKAEKGKPFSDMNIHQLMKQTKAFDRETQLLATLRGLQAEASIKDKENRKLKIEIESLKRQIKKMVNAKVDNCRKSSLGTQTIGLESFVQKPYNPENYEVPQDYEKENDELRSRVKALEVDFELLKEKRITDLQSLHQVHEEEMGKLVSKLETQSALTRHLHSLLINR